MILTPRSECVEDLTGGVTTKLISADVLDVDKLWSKEFMKVNYEFMFSGIRAHDTSSQASALQQGVEDGHACSLLRTTEYKGNRLCLVKDTRKSNEWNGPWSNSSKEWTPEALDALDHNFGSEGKFWMLYDDFLRRYSQILRTRLIGSEWNVTQHRTTVNVPWSGE